MKTLDERTAEHADGIIDLMACDPDAEPERWRAVQEAIRFCAVRSGWRLNFTASGGAPYVQGGERSITFRDDTGTWDFFGAGKHTFHTLNAAAASLAGVVANGGPKLGDLPQWSGAAEPL